MSRTDATARISCSDTARLIFASMRDLPAACLAQIGPGGTTCAPEAHFQPQSPTSDQLTQASESRTQLRNQRAHWRIRLRRQRAMRARLLLSCIAVALGGCPRGWLREETKRRRRRRQRHRRPSRSFRSRPRPCRSASEWITTLDGYANAQIRPQVIRIPREKAITARARWSAKARCSSRSTSVRFRSRWRRPKRSSARRAPSSGEPSVMSLATRRLPRSGRLRRASWTTTSSRKLAAEAAVNAAEASVAAARLNLELHEGPLADRWRRRDRDRTDWRSRRPDEPARDGLAGRSDPRVLLAERAGIPAASPARSTAAYASQGSCGRQAAA